MSRDQEVFCHRLRKSLIPFLFNALEHFFVFFRHSSVFPTALTLLALNGNREIGLDVFVIWE